MKITVTVTGCVLRGSAIASPAIEDSGASFLSLVMIPATNMENASSVSVFVIWDGVETIALMFQRLVLWIVRVLYVVASVSVTRVCVSVPTGLVMLHVTSLLKPVTLCALNMVPALKISVSVIQGGREPTATNRRNAPLMITLYLVSLQIAVTTVYVGMVSASAYLVGLDLHAQLLSLVSPRVASTESVSVAHVSVI